MRIFADEFSYGRAVSMKGVREQEKLEHLHVEVVTGACCFFGVRVTLACCVCVCECVVPVDGFCPQPFQ